MLKIWLREPQHTDDEAIKLMIDESADVSDILLHAPELLRVEHLRPAELQAVYNGVVLSNRLALTDVLSGAAEGTFVIQPRPDAIPAKPAAAPVMAGVASPSSASRASEKPRVKRTTTAPHRAPSPAKASAGTGVAQSTPQRSAARAASATRQRPSSRQPSGARPATGGSAARASSRNRVAGGTPSGSSMQQDGPTTNDGRVPPLQRSSSALQRSGSATRGPVYRQSTPQRTPRPISSDARSQSSLRSLPRHAESTPQTAERPRRRVGKPMSARLTRLANLHPPAPPKRDEVSIICEAFKPQWGNSLCATCKHSKQAHWMRDQERKAAMQAAEVNANPPEVHVDPLSQIANSVEYLTALEQEEQNVSQRANDAHNDNGKMNADDSAAVTQKEAHDWNDADDSTGGNANGNYAAYDTSMDDTQDVDADADQIAQAYEEQRRMLTPPPSSMSNDDRGYVDTHEDQ